MQKQVRNASMEQLLNIGGKLGVNLFVLIGGWHMSIKEYRAVRTVRLWLQTVSTGLMMLMLCGMIWGWQSVGNLKYALRQALFPIAGGGWWFSGAYIILTLLMPYLNGLLHSVGRRGMDILLGVLTVALSLVPTMFIGQAPYFAPIIWFIYLYLLAGRLRRWAVVPLAKHGINIFLCSVFFIWGSTLLLGYLKEHIESFSIPVNYYADRMETLPMLAASLGLFMAFVRKRPYTNVAMETAGRACFGIYLIHDNPLFRNHLWNEWIRAGALAQSPALIPYMVLVIGAVFGLTMGLELIRQGTVGRLEGWLIARLSEPLKKFDQIIRSEVFLNGMKKKR